MNTNILLGIAVVLVVIAGVYYATRTEPSAPVSNADDTAVRAMVIEFGSKLKQVSLLAPDAPTQIETQYSAYAAPELITTWKSEPQEAPGRVTSSPWPDSIDVVSVTAVGADTYHVEGNVVEITNANPKEPVDVYPITLAVKKNALGHWVITSYTKGQTSQLPARTTLSGKWECLPHKEKGDYQTLECAFGILADDGAHYEIDTSLMERAPVDYPTGARVRVTGIVTPVEQLNSVQIYDIKGVMRATEIVQI